MERDIYNEDHEAFRDVVREFIKRYATNEKRMQWDRDGEIDRQTLLAAGESGIIGLAVPEEFGGAGMLQDYRFRAIVNEEVIGAGLGSLAGALGIQDDLAVPYIVHMGTQEQKEKWLPRMAAGEILGALAMTEPSRRWASTAGIPRSCRSATSSCQRRTSSAARRVSASSSS